MTENLHRLILEAEQAELLALQTSHLPKGPSLRHRVSAFMKGVGSHTMDIKVSPVPQSPAALQSLPSQSPASSPGRLPPLLQLSDKSSVNTPGSVADGPPATLQNQWTLGASTFRSTSSVRSTFRSTSTLQNQSSQRLPLHNQSSPRLSLQNHSSQRLSINAKEEQFKAFQDDILHRDWLPIVDKLKNAKEVSFGMVGCS